MKELQESSHILQIKVGLTIKDNLSIDAELQVDLGLINQLIDSDDFSSPLV